MAKATSRYNVCSDWLRARSEGHFAPVIPTDRLQIMHIRARLNLNCFPYKERYIIKAS